MPLSPSWKPVLKRIRKDIRTRLEKLQETHSDLELKREWFTKNNITKENVDANCEPMQRVVKNWKQDVFDRQGALIVLRPETRLHELVSQIATV